MRFREKDVCSKGTQGIMLFRKIHREQTRESDLSGRTPFPQLAKRLLQRDCKGGPTEQPTASLETTAQSVLVLVPWLAGWVSLVFVKSFSGLFAKLLLSHQIIHGGTGLKQGVLRIHFVPPI